MFKSFQSIISCFTVARTVTRCPEMTCDVIFILLQKLCSKGGAKMSNDIPLVLFCFIYIRSVHISFRGLAVSWNGGKIFRRSSFEISRYGFANTSASLPGD